VPTDSDDDTNVDSSELGTMAASPHALAESAPPKAVGTGAPGASMAFASGPKLPTSAAEALESSDLPRMRKFHIFGIAAPPGAIILSLVIGGDPLALKLFWLGCTVMSLCNVVLVWMTGSPERWQPRPIRILWCIATMGTIPMLYYFGPFSAVVMILLLGVVFISLGKDRVTALAVTAICIVGHAVISIPQIAGWIPDVGLIPSTFAARVQLATAEILITGFVLSAYALGRWARHTSANALAELERAMRVIGDQQQVLAEARADVAKQARANEGRFTNHVMGDFRLGLVLGRGAMGEVYEAQRSDGHPAAVKLLNARATSTDSLVERFGREMSVAASLESPHIVKVLELSPPDAPVPYIAMERLHGIDLATKLRTEPRLPADELGVLLDHVGRGLEVARVAGVVHRDLKPHNLFFHEGAWKILDFGVSKLAGSEGTLTGEGIVGTPQYMAPEQAVGSHVTHLADVYALGAIAYRCLTGRTPFRGKDLSELVYQVVHQPPQKPSELGRISPGVEAVLAIAMAKDPRRRFPSALAFAQAYSAARRGRAPAVEPPANAWS